ncbi:MAG: Mut7-C RNAse domain-containing protein [Candidatus Caldarchaeum sp.]|nr:hypothetical protein [Candidatus Caldarchaeum sp.]MDW8062578.1 Mut7-C RNAse domain-containing protein [Candidatus Caldarchaeum sp.]MDW8435704.1 Mut7-C RNAse domain-containing protein [Candidatus Caldarchaeum sp.]
MLGHLLTWLRLFGYDTIYVRNMEDYDIMSLCRDDNRVLVTRDRALAEKAWKNGLRVVLLDTVEKVECLLQIAKVVGVNMRFNPDNSRCPSCNALLTKLFQDPVRWVCKGCGKQFWVGRHWKNIDKVLKMLEEKSRG